MSDSSSEEDLSRFQEVVDTTFIKLVNRNHFNKLGSISKTEQIPRSERYLEEAGHYNDVKVSKELQNRIGAKVSLIINKNLKYIEVQEDVIRNQTIEGGVKLFKDSAGLLLCEDIKDTFTENHNNLSKNIKKKRRLVDEEFEVPEEAKIKLAAVSGAHVQSTLETKCWKSRRKEKIFKYRGKGGSKVLTVVE